MKYLKILLPFIVAIVTFLYLAIPLDVFAANEQVFISPSSRRYDPGSTFTVDVRINSGTSRGASTNAIILYDSSILRAESVSTAGSAYGGITSINNSNAPNQGRIWHYALKIPAPTGSNLLVYKVTFKAIATGNARVWASEESMVNGTRNVSRPAVTYSISNPAPPTPPAPPAPKPNPTPTPAPAPRPAPTPAPRPAPRPAPTPATPAPSAPTPNTDDSTGNEEEIIAEEPLTKDEPTLTISNIWAKALYDKADISWETNHPSTSILKYGTSENNLDNEAKITSKEADLEDPESFPSFSTTLTKLRPGVKYFYNISAVKSADKDLEDSHQGSFTTKGYPVKIIVQNNDQPVQGATVTIKDHNGSYTTNKDGVSNLNLRDGKYTISVKKENLSAQESITVKATTFAEGKAPDTQEFLFKIIQTAGSTGSTNLLPLIIGGAILGLLGIFGLIIFLVRRKRAKEADAYGYQSIIDDGGPSAAPEQYYTDTQQPAYSQDAYYDYSATDQQVAYNDPAAYSTPGESPTYAGYAAENYAQQPYADPTSYQAGNEYPQQPATDGTFSQYSQEQLSTDSPTDQYGQEQAPTDNMANQYQADPYQAQTTEQTTDTAAYQEPYPTEQQYQRSPEYNDYTTTPTEQSQSNNQYSDQSQYQQPYYDSASVDQQAINYPQADLATQATEVSTQNDYQPTAQQDGIMSEQASYQINNMQQSDTAYANEMQASPVEYQQTPIADQDAFDTYAQLQSSQPPSTMQ